MFITYPATPESSTLSLHDALPILTTRACAARRAGTGTSVTGSGTGVRGAGVRVPEGSTGRASGEGSVDGSGLMAPASPTPSSVGGPVVGGDSGIRDMWCSLPPGDRPVSRLLSRMTPGHGPLVPPRLLRCPGVLPRLCSCED